MRDGKFGEKTAVFLSALTFGLFHANLFQFFYDTKSLYGNLKDIIQPPSIDEIKQSIKISSENLYHATVHSFVHSNNYVEDVVSFELKPISNFNEDSEKINTFINASDLNTFYHNK